jgi:hypothetical protein
LIAETGGGIRILTTARVRTRTRPAASLYWRSTAEIGTTKICVKLYATEMHVAELKTSAKRKTASSVDDTRRGTLITMVPTMTNPTVTILWPKDTMKGASRLSHTT